MTCAHYQRSDAAIRGDGLRLGNAGCTCSSDCACKMDSCPLTTEQVLEALHWVARGLSRTMNVGAFDCKSNRDIGAWSRDVRPGDLVYAVTARSGHNGVEDGDRIGVLMRREDVTVCRHLLENVNLAECNDSDCLPGNGGHQWVEHFTWVRTLRSRHRWYNETFSRIPRNVAEFDEMCEGRLRTCDFCDQQVRKLVESNMGWIDVVKPCRLHGTERWPEHSRRQYYEKADAR